jgi:hypothetical protein
MTDDIQKKLIKALEPIYGKEIKESDIPTIQRLIQAQLKIDRYKKKHLTGFDSDDLLNSIPKSNQSNS